MPYARPALVALTAALLLTSCSSSGSRSVSQSEPAPAASDFAPGACRDVAQAVLAIHQGSSQLGTGPTPPAAVLDRLTTAQDVLRAKLGGVQRPGAATPPAAATPGPSADPGVTKALENLSEAVGLVRIRSAGNMYSVDLVKDLTRGYDGVLVACGLAPIPVGTPSP